MPGFAEIQLLDLAIQRGYDFLLTMSRALESQLPAMPFSRVRRARDRPVHRPSGAVGSLQLLQCLVDQEDRRDQAPVAIGDDPSELIVELLRVGLKTREIRFRVVRSLDLVFGVKEARDVKVGLGHSG